MKIQARVPFSRREIVAMHFAAALIRSRDQMPDSHPRATNAHVVRDAFAFADAFLDEDLRKPDPHGALGECGCS